MKLSFVPDGLVLSCFTVKSAQAGLILDELVTYPNSHIQIVNKYTKYVTVFNLACCLLVNCLFI